MKQQRCFEKYLCLLPESSNDAYSSKWHALKVNLKGKQMSAGVCSLSRAKLWTELESTEQTQNKTETGHWVIIHTK